MENKIAELTTIKPHKILCVLTLLNEGCTVPFIARYRKERTGGLDETEIITIRDLAELLQELEKRKEYVLKVITEQGKLTPELQKKIRDAKRLAEVEDLYLPYKKKRKTRAVKAIEMGLENLALFIMAKQQSSAEDEAGKYLNNEKGVDSIETALQGARDIIAEKISEDPETRKKQRDLFYRHGSMISKVIKSKKKDAEKYKDYFDWTEHALKAPSHRILAVLRGTAEKFLTSHFHPDSDPCIKILSNRYYKGSSHMKQAIEDSYKRLIQPGLETELKNEVKAGAEEKAIEVFAENLKELLLASPLGGKSMLALDPGFRTGCKAVVLDAQGNLLKYDTIYPLEPHNKTVEAERKINALIKGLNIDTAAVGNGTGGREAEAFLKSLAVFQDTAVIMVSEAGASVYSASEAARDEFPDLDLTVRGAASIGRRLMDPLSELVKIDPKSIGVGQYQHDVDQKRLKKTLDDVVVSCVNTVGINLNTASAYLLQYVSGLNIKLAKKIVQYRQMKGIFPKRDSLKKVPGFGEKTFQQAAGFLRVPESGNPLDNTGIHPEQYALVQTIAKEYEDTVADFISKKKIPEIQLLEKYCNEQTGMLTITDIITELKKPGRDPRGEFELFSYTENINAIEDLEEGMKLSGIITNVTAFGAFCDIGVHQDGLIHISKLADSFVKNPGDIVKVNQKVKVTVIEIDKNRKRISLSLID